MRRASATTNPVIFTALAFFAVLLVAVKPLGSYIDDVFAGRRTFATPLLGRLETASYRLCRIDPDSEMTWQRYTFALIAVSITSIAAVYVVLRVQAYLPLNPQHFPNLAPDLAWNTAISFATTTDWQFYSGENTMSYLSQMMVLGWQSFIAPAVGLAVAIVLARSLALQKSRTIGNLWVDMTRGIVYLLLPISLLFALAFVWQGEPQNFAAYRTARTLDGPAQTITGGPMASQESIKLLGGNGGGFVGANSSSPTENPTPLSNFLQLLAMFLIPAALTYTFGRIVKDTRQGWMLFWAMTTLFVAAVVAASVFEMQGNPLIHQIGVGGGNMEGKEVRFGVADAGLSLAVATDSTVGAGNFTYDSLTPAAGLVALVDMQLGEVAFGGVGSGLYGMLTFVVLTVFVAGLLVGRTPEYLGKKLERREITFAMLAILAFPISILVPAAIASVVPAGLATLGNAGPHGFSEIVYAFSSAAASNGSAMGGLGPNSFYNVALGLTMGVGRYAVIVPTLALAGALAAKPRNDVRGTLRTDTPLFAILLLGNVIVVGALTFLPADALGPVYEAVAQHAGRTF